MFAAWIKTLIAAAVMAVAAGGGAYAVAPMLASSNLRQIIDSTDTYIADRARYSSAKVSDISARKQALARCDSGDSLTAMLDLGRAYRRYDVDSSAYYYHLALDRARRSDDSAAVRLALIALASVNPLRGIVRESVDMYESVDPALLDSAALRRYYESGFDVYLSTASFYPEGLLRQGYAAKAAQCADSLVALLPERSPERLYYSGWHALQRGDMHMALADMRAALDATEVGDELYARIAANIADYYQDYMADNDAAAFYLALSAISDIVAGTRETTSLQRLGLDLYSRGDVERAYRYMDVALDNSIGSGSKIRTLAEIEALPIVSKAYRDKDKNRIGWLIFLVMILSAALVALAIMLYKNRRAGRRMADYRRRLSESNLVKDDYIKQILALCSSYIERTESMNRLVVRKIKAGQSQELCKMAESGDMLREQNDKFLKSFDEAFFMIYPDFIARLNDLLLPAERFKDVSEKRLTPELRIAAFMRLGVDDSQRIARFLGLSLNTVYTYRNKLRNRAANRENFEDDVKKIGLIS